MRNVTKPAKKKSTGTMVMEAIQKKSGKKKTHLEVLVQAAAMSAAEQAAHKAAKLGGHAATTAAGRAAKLAAKKAVLAQVRKAAAVAARKAKESLKNKTVKAQAAAAAAAATEAAKHVLSIAKHLVEGVAHKAAQKAVAGMAAPAKPSPAKPHA